MGQRAIHAFGHATAHQVFGQEHKKRNGTPRFVGIGNRGRVHLVGGAKPVRRAVAPVEQIASIAALKAVRSASGVPSRQTKVTIRARTDPDTDRDVQLPWSICRCWAR